jgi:fibronectin-binding autotransporter adhesin
MGKVNMSRRFRRSAVAGAALAAALPLVPRAAQAQNSTNYFNTGTDLTNPGGYSQGLPTASEDVVLNTSSGTTLTYNSNSGLAAGSLDVTNGTAYTVTMTAANTSSITLGGGLNGVSANQADLLYLSGNSSSLNISNGGGGTLGLVLGATGNVDVATGSTLLVGSVISGTNGLTVIGGGTTTVTANNTYSGGTAVLGGNLVANFGFNTNASSGGSTPTSGPLGMNVSSISIGATNGSSNSSILFGFTGGNGSSASLNYNLTVNAGSTGTSSLTFENSNPNGTINTSAGSAITFQNSTTLNNNLTINNDVADYYGLPHLMLQGLMTAGTTGLKTLTINDIGVMGNNSSNGLANTNIGTVNGSGGALGTSLTISDGAGQVAVVFAGNQYGQALIKSPQTYTGGTTIQGGLVLLQTPSAFASTGNMTLDQTSSTANAVLNLGTYNLSVGALSTAGTGTTGNQITGTSPAVLTVNGTGTYAGEILSSMGLTVANNANLTLTGNASTYTGPTQISSGSTLTLATGKAAGSNASTITIAGGGTLALTNQTDALQPKVALSAATSTISVASGITYNSSSVVSGTGTLNKTGTGTLYLTASNTFGASDVQAGTLQIGTQSSLGTATNTTTIETSGTLMFQEGASGNPSLGSGRTIALNGSGGRIGVSTVSNTTPWTIAGLVEDGSGAAGTLNKIGTGTLELTSTSANTYSGGTNVSAGVLVGTTASAFGTGPVTVNPTGTAGTTADAATLNAASGSIATTAAVTVNTNTNSNFEIGTLNLTGASTTIGSLAGSGAVVLCANAGALVTGGAGTNTTFSGTISDNGTATGSLTKAGGATFTLSGSESYGGTTNVSAGTLALSSATSTNPIGSSSKVLVSGGATLDVTNVSATGGFTLAENQTLAGSGAVSGATTVATGSTVTAGTGATSGDTVGTLHLTAASGTPALTLAGGTYVAKVTNISQTTTSSNVNDELVVSGFAVTSASMVTLQPTTTLGFLVSNPGLTSMPTAGSYIVLAEDTESAGSNPLNPANGQAVLQSLTLNPNGVQAASSNDSIKLETIADADQSGFDLVAEDVAATPEPASLLLLGVAGAPLALGRRRRAPGERAEPAD